MIHGVWPPLSRTDPVAPVIGIGETPAGPAEYGNRKRAKVLHRASAEAIDVGYRAVASDPDPSVRGGPEMFEEMTVHLRPDEAEGIATRLRQELLAAVT